MSPNDALITGAALTPFNRRKDGSGFRDWAAQAFDAAILMAQIDPGEIDTLFVASESDFFSMQLNPAAVLATELGLIGAAATRCEGGGASGQVAVHAAANAIRSGMLQHAAVVGVDPSASCLAPQTIRDLYGFSFDAWTDGFSDVGSTGLYALSYQAFAAEFQSTDSDLAAVTMQNRAHACNNPGAHLPRQDNAHDIMESPAISSPYRRLHCSPLSDGAAALIISNAANVPKARAKAPRVAGIGAGTDHMHLGARPAPGHFTAKARAMARACIQANIKPAKIGLAEIYDAYAGAQLQGLHALGLSQNPVRDLRRGDFAKDGRCPINLSGGLMGQGAPVGATGVGQTATIALQLEGRYHPRLQLENLPRYALADTHGGICTLAATTVLERGQ